MGRPERALRRPAWRTAEFPLWRLADYLRRVRDRAGLSYQEMADRTQLPKATLQRAADGKTLPGSETVEAYAVACGRDPRTAVRWRERAAGARRRKRRTTSRSRPVSSPDPALTPRPARIVRPDQVTTFDDLVEALAYLRRGAGTPTLKELAERDGRLPPSTTSDLLRRKTRRPRREVVLAFAQACGEPDASLREWAEAWSRARPTPARRPVVAASRAREATAPKVREKSGKLPDPSRRNRT
jgi:transcriptional regulator with XRE-family HTH domain